MNIALILSGGRGTRLGSEIPKQYIKVCGKTVISYCLEALSSHPMIDAVHIVADNMWQEIIAEDFDSDKFRGFSAPGETRQLSILNGLNDIMKYADEKDYILIHDAARPLLSAAMITECLDAAHRHEGSLPVIPMKDTVYLSENGSTVSGLLDRSRLFAGQAPEAFILGKYYDANKALLPDRIMSINGSAEPAVIAGMDIAMISGDERNFKITTKADLERFCEIIKQVKQ